MHQPPPSTAAVVEANRQRYERLLEVVAHHASVGDTERVLRAAVQAANYAWVAPNGLLSDPRLEHLVVEAVRDGGTVVVDRSARTGRVLHVLSEAYATGGHTRQVTGWMDLDGRPCDVALTSQVQEVPARLVDQVEAGGGRLTDLRAAHADLLVRARALRALMGQADLVVLTVHPYDAIALAAVNLPGPRPPVLLTNHADLAFWLGVAAADVVCDWRSGAAALARPHRGVPAGRLAVVPLPVQEEGRADGPATRAALGVSPDQVLALCVSDDWKVSPSWGRGMVHAVDRVLHWNPQVVMLLVGVTATEPWARLGRRHPGRLRLTGRVADPSSYYAAADVFIESYPVRAGTTPLEAATHGLPVVALVDIPEGHPLHVFQTSSPGLEDAVVVGSAEKLGSTVRRLLADRARLSSLGTSISEATWAAHAGAGWRAALDAALAQAAELPAVDVAELGDLHADTVFAQALLSAVWKGPSPDPRQLVDPVADLADDRSRADLFVALSRDLGPQLQVRVGTGWETREGDLRSLLELCATRPHLAVSLPFLPADDMAGSRTETLLLTLLAEIGRDGEDCGALSIDVERPAHAGPSVSGDLPLEPAAMAWLTTLVDSPLWAVVDVVGGTPVPDRRRVGSVMS